MAVGSSDGEREVMCSIRELRKRPQPSPVLGPVADGSARDDAECAGEVGVDCDEAGEKMASISEEEKTGDAKS
jgi:hypothetical protein